MNVYAVQLNDAIVAVSQHESRAARIAHHVKENEDEQHHRHVFVRTFKLDEWPEQWAGKEPTKGLAK